MPVLKHAKKKLRQDHKRAVDNLRIKRTYKKLVKDARNVPSEESISAAFSAIDKAAKKQVIHKNKAARLKSSLSKVASGDAPKVVADKRLTKKAKAAKVSTLKKAAKKAAKNPSKKK